MTARALLSIPLYERVDWKPRLQKIDGRRVYKFAGNLVGEQFFAGMDRLHPVEDLTHARGPVAYISGTKDRLVGVAALENLRRRVGAAGVKIEVVPITGGDHVFMEPAMQRQAVAAAAAWLGRALHAPAWSHPPRQSGKCGKKGSGPEGNQTTG